MRKTVIILLLLTFVSFELWPQSYAETEIVSVEKKPRILRTLSEGEFDVLMVEGRRIYLVCSQKDLIRLEEENVSYTIETQNFYPYLQSSQETKGGINGDYHSYLELERDLFALESAYPHLARVYDIGDSLEQRNIYALKVSDNVSLDEQEAEVFFCGCHHAREWISVEVPFLLGKYLVENYNSNPSIKALVDRSEIWIVPLVNPDGLEYTIHVYRYWRKNRRHNGDGSYGVDLNRNYGYNWGYDNRGSSPDPSSGVYRGPSAFSEPETRAIRDLFLQRNFQAMITYHNYSQVILYPWGYTTAPTEDDAIMEDIAARMSELMAGVNGTIYDYGRSGADLYLTNGDTTDWTYGLFGIPSFTIELPPVDVPHGGFFNAEEDIISIFEENLQAALALIDYAIQNFDQDIRPRQKRIIRFKAPRKFRK
ncbi:MAG: M14 family metallopeptidase [Candidatus Aminicenantales bacterium]